MLAGLFAWLYVGKYVGTYIQIFVCSTSSKWISIWAGAVDTSSSFSIAKWVFCRLQWLRFIDDFTQGEQFLASQKALCQEYSTPTTNESQFISRMLDSSAQFFDMANKKFYLAILFLKTDFSKCNLLDIIKTGQ